MPDKLPRTLDPAKMTAEELLQQMKAILRDPVSPSQIQEQAKAHHLRDIEAEIIKRINAVKEE
jgi:hypothetical protein